MADGPFLPFEELTPSWVVGPAYTLDPSDGSQGMLSQLLLAQWI